jgi:hypothetical protein
VPDDEDTVEAFYRKNEKAAAAAEDAAKTVAATDPKKCALAVRACLRAKDGRRPARNVDIINSEAQADRERAQKRPCIERRLPAVSVNYERLLKNGKIKAPAPTSMNQAEQAFADSWTSAPPSLAVAPVAPVLILTTPDGQTRAPASAAPSSSSTHPSGSPGTAADALTSTDPSPRPDGGKALEPKAPSRSASEKTYIKASHLDPYHETSELIGDDWKLFYQLRIEHGWMVDETDWQAAKDIWWRRAKALPVPRSKLASALQRACREMEQKIQFKIFSGLCAPVLLLDMVWI